MVGKLTPAIPFIPFPCSNPSCSFHSHASFASLLQALENLGGQASSRRLTRSRACFSDVFAVHWLSHWYPSAMAEAKWKVNFRINPWTEVKWSNGSNSILRSWRRSEKQSWIGDLVTASQRHLAIACNSYVDGHEMTLSKYVKIPQRRLSHHPFWRRCIF